MTLILSVLAVCWAAAAGLDRALTPGSKKRFVSGVSSVASIAASKRFQNIFDWLFGYKLFSIRSFLISAAISTLSLVLIFSGLATWSNGWSVVYSNIEFTSIQLQLLASMYVANLLADYLSYTQTRMFVKEIGNARQFGTKCIFAISDLVTSLCLFCLVGSLGITASFYLYSNELGRVTDEKPNGVEFAVLSTFVHGVYPYTDAAFEEILAADYSSIPERRLGEEFVNSVRLVEAGPNNTEAYEHSVEFLLRFQSSGIRDLSFSNGSPYYLPPYVEIEAGSRCLDELLDEALAPSATLAVFGMHSTSIDNLIAIQALEPISDDHHPGATIASFFETYEESLEQSASSTDGDSCKSVSTLSGYFDMKRFGSSRGLFDIYLSSLAHSARDPVNAMSQRFVDVGYANMRYLYTSIATSASISSSTLNGSQNYVSDRLYNQAIGEHERVAMPNGHLFLRQLSASSMVPSGLFVLLIVVTICLRGFRSILGFGMRLSGNFRYDLPFTASIAVTTGLLALVLAGYYLISMIP